MPPAKAAMQLPAKQPPPAAPATAGLPANAEDVKEELSELSSPTPAWEAAVSLSPTPLSNAWASSDSDSGQSAVSGSGQDSTADEGAEAPWDVEDWSNPQREAVLQPSDGGRRPAPATAGFGNREVIHPYLLRDNVGKYAVYHVIFWRKQWNFRSQ